MAVSDPIQPLAYPKLHTGITSNTNISDRINGSNISNSFVATSSETNPFQFGGSSAATSGLNGDIDEILVYNAPLTETQIKRVEAYLNAKYNLY